MRFLLAFALCALFSSSTLHAQCAIQSSPNSGAPSLLDVPRRITSTVDELRARAAALRPQSSAPRLFELAETLRDLSGAAQDEAAGAEAIRVWATIVQDHPAHPRIDEVLFELAMALARTEQHDRARQVFHRLISRHPQSDRVPRAYLAFAVYYLGQRDADAASRFLERATSLVGTPVGAMALYLDYLKVTLRVIQGRNGTRSIAALRDRARADPSPESAEVVAAIEADWCR